MIRRLYIHNFRCLENFELPVSGQQSVLLIGKNGSGKTTVARGLEILQRIARGTNRVGALVAPSDLARGRADVPMRFEIEAELGGAVYNYTIAFEFPPGFRELRVSEEKLLANGAAVYARTLADVTLARNGQEKEAKFKIDWHLVALPIVQEQSEADPIFVFKRWLRQCLILRPIPALVSGDSTSETLEPGIDMTDFAAWFSGVIANAPSSYARVEDYLKQIMPDLLDIKNPQSGKDSRSLVVQFCSSQVSVTIPFGDLSDGEKCFMICALVIAANGAYGPLLCFWDEPDNYLALDEVGHFVLALRKAFESGGQLIATSHNPEAIRSFTDDTTLVLYRNSHLEPTVVRPLSDIHVSGDLISALIRGDVAP